MNRRNMIIALMGATAVLPGYSAQKSTTPKPNTQAIVNEKVKELLLLMDTDKNGKISRKEWMDFMAAEFDRLDKDKNGELDPKELAGSQVYARPLHPSNVGK